jgi:hypothetical protein
LVDYSFFIYIKLVRRVRGSLFQDSYNPLFRNKSRLYSVFSFEYAFLYSFNLKVVRDAKLVVVVLKLDKRYSVDIKSWKAATIFNEKVKRRLVFHLDKSESGNLVKYIFFYCDILKAFCWLVLFKNYLEPSIKKKIFVRIVWNKRLFVLVQVTVLLVKVFQLQPGDLVFTQVVDLLLLGTWLFA